MNNPSSKSNKKTIVIGIVLVVLLGAGWYFYKGGSPSASSSSSGLIASTPDGSATDEGGVGSDVLTILNSVSSIHIDTSLFSSPVYESLVDYSITVPPQAVG